MKTYIITKKGKVTKIIADSIEDAIEVHNAFLVKDSTLKEGDIVVFGPEDTYMGQKKTPYKVISIDGLNAIVKEAFGQRKIKTKISKLIKKDKSYLNNC